VFLSYSGDDAFEASLLQFAFETTLRPVGGTVWTFERDQSRSQASISRSIKEAVIRSAALLLLVSPATVQSGATQWMELAYADAFDVPTFILLSHITYDQLKRRKRGVPPLLLESQCNPAIHWKDVLDEIKGLFTKSRVDG
jgi:hypothetical protein